MMVRPQPTQFARSLLGMGEPVRLERFAGTTERGGYHQSQYHVPERVQVLLRPGDIDVPFIDTSGRQGTHDYWCIASPTDNLGERDLVTRLRGFGTTGFGEQQFGEGSTYEVSMRRECPVQGIALYQLDEADER